jgi:UDP-GlcNAc:undecaprenyl-phosphate GlcNAc-1-phosphate transferase
MFIAILLFVISILVSFLINGLFLRFSRNLGMRNIENEQIRWASTTKPALGGFSFYIVFLLSIAFYAIISERQSFLNNEQLLGILMSSTLGFFIGLADDAYNTKPILKLLGQISCGLILIFSGTLIHISENLLFNQILTVFWIVGIMNSINMLDNMDGITTSVSIFIIIGVLMVLYITKAQEAIFFYISIGTLGALIGFLFYNWNPSKIYMGDTGSQFLGALLGALGIICFWETPFDFILHHPTKKVLLTLIVFIVPICDTTTVTINRLLAKKSPFVGGKDHTTHHLSYLGFSEKKIALIMMLISGISLFVAYTMISNYDWDLNRIFIYSLYFFLFLFLLYSTTWLVKRKKSKS